MTTYVPERIDGRRARGEATRHRILDAYIAVCNEDGDPTAQAVANKAGTALRTLYHGFDDVATLRDAAIRYALDRQLDAAINRMRLPEGATTAQAIARFTTRLWAPLEAVLRTGSVPVDIDAQRIAALRTLVGHSLPKGAEGFVLEVLTSWPAWQHARVNRPTATTERELAGALTTLLGEG